LVRCHASRADGLLVKHPFVNMTPKLDRREMIGLLGASAVLGVATRWATAAAPLQTAASKSALSLPAGATIRTVLTDVPPDSLPKATLFHEHLSFEWARVAPQSNRSGPAKDAAPVLEQVEAAAADG